jgi:hypothetical protein
MPSVRRDAKFLQSEMPQSFFAKRGRPPGATKTTGQDRLSTSLVDPEALALFTEE